MSSSSSPSWSSFLVGVSAGAVTVASVAFIWHYRNKLRQKMQGNNNDGRNSSLPLETHPVTPDNIAMDTLDGTAAFSTQRSLFLTDNNPGLTSQHALTVTDMSVTAEVIGRGGGGERRGGGGEDDQSDADQLYRHEDNQSLLNLLFNIAEDQAKKEGFIHRGITCNMCQASPICGIRYKCANCVDFDICERCEPHDRHNRLHTFIKIKIPIPPLANPRTVLFKPFYPGKEKVIKRCTWDDINTLKKITHFDQYEIEALHEQFRVLCNKEQGITREVYDQCLGPLGLEKSLLLERLFKFYDANGDGYIDFTEFTCGLSTLVKGSFQEKVKYAFEGYDLEGVGSISRDNLRQMFKAYFYVTIELVRDVVKACEEEMMANFDDNQGRPVSSLFSAPIPSDTGSQITTTNGKIPFPGNPGSKEDTWPVMEAMSQDAIEEMVDNVFKMAKIDPDHRITLEQFRNLAIVDSSLVAWFDSLGPIF
ncbi:uncharacterized protein LOC121410448 isoform X2 [Lytechinus variegatus]|uniref:uncharacterized protein LOC121410448 isoform X2 n=1 Tax=Lytechinus variegatus TaxID=7654 RepID=UPI001BB1C968|nr:uncharacterized protein LOC121410448 isoform X2 [Lytechinus variegatus]